MTKVMILQQKSSFLTKKSQFNIKKFLFTNANLQHLPWSRKTFMTSKKDQREELNTCSFNIDVSVSLEHHQENNLFASPTYLCPKIFMTKKTLILQNLILLKKLYIIFFTFSLMKILEIWDFMVLFFTKKSNISKFTMKFPFFMEKSCFLLLYKKNIRQSKSLNIWQSCEFIYLFYVDWLSPGTQEI